MRIQKAFAVACVVSFLNQFVQAAPPTTFQEAIDQVEADSVLLSEWLSNEFKTAIPFNSTSGNVVPTQFKLFGIGFGVSAVVSSTKMDEDALHNLGTQVVNTNEIDTFSRLPFPMILGHAKVGLPLGLDAGVRIGGIPSKESDEGDTHLEISNTVFGLDLRKQVIEEGITRPFGLTVGLNYTHAKGHISATTPYDPNTISDVTLAGPNGTGAATGSARSEWNTDSVGVQALLNKRILFVNPYIGASINKNFGDVETSIINRGSITGVGGGAIVPENFTTIGSATEDADGVDIRALLGLEFTFLPFLKLSLGGELANQGKAAASLGLRFQFR